MMRSKAKLLQSIADEFLEKTAQLSAPNITTEEAKAKLRDMDTEATMENIEKTIISDLALKNVQPADIFFRQYVILEGPQLNYSLNFSRNILPQVNTAVARNKAAHPNFLLSNYVHKIVERFNPEIPVITGSVALG